MKKFRYGLILSLAMVFTSAYAEVSPDSIVNIFQRLETLEKKVRELNGDNEVLKHKIDQLKKAQKEGFLNIDERMEELAKPKEQKEAAVKSNEDSKGKDAKVKIVDYKPTEKTAVDSSVPDEKKDEKKPGENIKSNSDKTEPRKAEAKKTSNIAVSQKNKPRAPTAYEKETYQAAFNLMKTSPTAATKAFQEYIKMQPNSPLAANAQYWIAEIMYSHNNYKGAINEFIKVLQKYKYSSKAPDAAIKLGYSFYALKNWDFAKRTFEDVLKYFPENKNATNLANKRLAKMKAEGH